MKMRGWIVVLLLLNALALAWHWDVFGRWGWGPNAQSEPERLQQQIMPEALTVTVPVRGATLPSSSLVSASEPYDKQATGADTAQASGPSASAPKPVGTAPASAP